MKTVAMGGRPQCPCGKTLGHPDPCSPDGPRVHESRRGFDAGS